MSDRTATEWLRVHSLRRWLARLESGAEYHQPLIPSLRAQMDKRQEDGIARLREKCA